MKHFTKKLLAVLLLTLPFITNAQLSEQWNISHSWNTSKNSRGIAFNPANNHLYVSYIEGTSTNANTPEANKIIVLNASTGDSIKALDLTGLTLNDNGYGLRDVEVSSDGGIFAVISTTNQWNPIKIYYWSDEDAQAVELWEDASGVDTDQGPGFSVYGDFSTEALIILPKYDVNSIFYFEVNNGVLGDVNSLTLTGITGGTGVHINAVGTRISDGFWYSNSTTAPTFIDGNGNITGNIDAGLFSGTTGDVKQFSAGANNYLCVSDGGAFHIIDITNANADFSNITATEFVETIAGTAPVAPGWPPEYGDGQEQAVIGSPDGAYAVYSLSGGNYIKMLTQADAAPIATNIQVTGTPQEGQTLSASYFYIDFNNDPEGTSTFRWLNSDTPDGTYTEIAGAAALTYTLAAGDVGKYVKFEVTPVASSGTPLTGTAVLSYPSTQIVSATEEFPTASDVTFSGNLLVNFTLTGSYTYSDNDGDAEGESTYKWYAADDAAGTNAVEIAGANALTYTLTAAEDGKHIAFEVTPVTTTGSLLVGDPVLSPYSADPVTMPAAAPPVAENVTISGTEEVGMVLTGTYTYFDINNDPEGVSILNWYRADDDQGTNMITIANDTNMYLLTAADEAKYIFFGVTPVQDDATQGTEVYDTTGVIAPYNDQAPVASNVVLSGTPETGALLSGSYDYSDYNSDIEGTSIYKWYSADDAAGTNATEITGAVNRTYLVTDAEIGKFIAFEVTPVAAGGITTTGNPVLSNYTAVASVASSNEDGLERMWVGSQKYGALPWYLGTGTTERGFAAGANHIYVASRKDGDNILIIDKNDGSFIGKMNTNGITAGYYKINDVEVSDDGQILACGLNLDASTSPFVVYKWTDESAAPEEWLSVMDAELGRIGKFTVTGDVSSGIAIVLAAVQSSDKVVRWVITDGTPGAPEIITLAQSTNLLPAAVPLSLAADADILVSAKGFTPTIFSSTGDSISSIPHIDEYSVSGNQATSPNVFVSKGRTLAAFFQALRSGAEKGARVIVADITEQPFQIVDSSEYIAVSDGWYGEVDVTVDGDFYNAYILETNLGLGRYKGEVVFPEFVSAETSLDGLSISAEFSKLIDNTSVSGNGFWTVLSDGTNIAVNNVTSSSDTITFELASAIAEGETVTIAYDGNGTVTSFDGMPLAAFGPEDVLNLVNASAPEAQNVSISGGLYTGDVVTGTYTFYDANGDTEGVSVYKWYRADDASGTNTNTILGETSTTMTIATDLSGKYIAFEVTPVAVSGGADYLIGTPAVSSWFGPFTNVGTENIQSNNITVYPNPVNSVLFVKHADNISRITITNITGQNIIKLNTNNSPEIKLNVNNLKTGVYFITFYNEKGLYSISKFIKIN